MPTARMAPYCRARAETLMEMLLTMFSSEMPPMMARKPYSTMRTA